MATHAWVHRATFKIPPGRLSLPQSIVGKHKSLDHQASYPSHFTLATRYCLAMFDLINFKLKKRKQRKKKRNTVFQPVADRTESKESSLQISLEYTCFYDVWKQSKSSFHTSFSPSQNQRHFLRWVNVFLIKSKYLKLRANADKALKKELFLYSDSVNFNQTS